MIVMKIMNASNIVVTQIPSLHINQPSRNSMRVLNTTYTKVVHTQEIANVWKC